MLVKKAVEISDAKIQFISLVDKAANKRQFLVTKSETDDGSAQFSTLGKILKVDEATHYVTGIVYEPLVEDAHSNFMTEAEIQKAAYWFAKNGDKVDLQHSFEAVDGVSVVETYIAPCDMQVGDAPIVKGMSTVMPASAADIAGVAEAAGQLGIATDDITTFTEVMINLGEATNLTSEEAASSLAKFTNITGMSATNYENLGSTVVALGNNFATTEADIVAMSTRLASAGTLAGLTEPEILALAASMSSVGIEADAGGSAMSKLLTDMQVAVETGSDRLEEFALHEMVHLHCRMNDINETCQKGRYHNKTFKLEAEARDLEIGYDRAIGYSPTKPTEAFIKTLTDNGFALEVPFARQMIEMGKTKADREKAHKYVCPLCGQEVKTTSELSLICGVCEVTMSRED